MHNRLCLVAVLAACAALSSCTTAPVSVGTDTSGPVPKISGAPRPADAEARPYLRAVVKVTAPGQDAGCTGTLVTPRLVMTAAHCFGHDSPNPADRGVLRGGDPACVVEDGQGRRVATGGCGMVKFTHLDGVVRSSALIRHVWVVRAVSSAVGRADGFDIALAALDRRATQDTAAAAPSVPVWFEGDPGVGHWNHADVVYAGWGQTAKIADTCEGIGVSGDTIPRLSVEWRKRLDRDFPVDSQTCCFPRQKPLGAPMFVANFDLYGDSTGLVLKGDSGGPLFSPDRSGRMSVVGVTSGVSCFDSEFSGTLQSLWARSFEPESAALIRRVVHATDGRPRGSDIDADDPDRDRVSATPPPDMNPWIPERDNCIDVANPDQLDSNLDGIGDACAQCPRGVCTPLPPVPTGCRISPGSMAHCGDVSVRCDAPLPVADRLALRSSVPGLGLEVYRTQADIGLVSASYLNGGTTTLQVCAVNIAGPNCSAGFEAVLLDRTAACLPTGPRPPRPCPTNQVLCHGRCALVDQCDFFK